MILVDVKNLAPVSGTAFLRLFDHRANMVKNLAALFEAPEVGKLSRDAIGAVMTKRKNKDLFEGEIPSITDLMDQKRAEGIAEGTRATLIRQLERRFGPLPDEAKAKIEAARERQLQAWTDVVLDARSLKAVLETGSRRARAPRRR